MMIPCAAMGFAHIQLSNSDKNELLAQKIDKRIKELGLTRQDFAKVMDVQPSSITKWLSGKHNFTLETLYEIERRLALPLINLSASHKLSALYSLQISSSDVPVSSDAGILHHFRGSENLHVNIKLLATAPPPSVIKTLNEEAKQEEYPSAFEFFGLAKLGKNP
jgi:transcriptional regulator with XRE-family HTH domain